MTTLYNELDPYAAEWLRNLSSAGHIARGEVDVRSIRDLRPEDVRGATQFHAFAGIGVWSYALRLAGWPDDLPVWTGSCPCQPFSAAGKRGGFDDERHLWPEWFRLIRECRPPIIFGEQVASPAGLKWFDAVSADLEGEGYAVGAADLCAAGVGAPHIRQRLFWVAFPCEQRRERLGVHLLPGRQGTPGAEAARGGSARGLGNSNLARITGRSGSGEVSGAKAESATRLECGDGTEYAGAARGLGNAGSSGSRRDAGAIPLTQREGAGPGQVAWRLPDEFVPSGATRGFWSDAEWLYCRDEKLRPVEPGSFPLAHGATSRVGRLRAYGNAIIPQVAATFIRAVMS